jgi:hypothetical protein
MFKILSSKSSLKLLLTKLPVSETTLVDTQDEEWFTVTQDPFSPLQTDIAAQCSCIVAFSAHEYATYRSESKT